MAIQFKTGSPSSAGDFSVPPGNYKLEVVDAIETHSKAGDPMLKIKFAIVTDTGADGHTLYEYFTLTAATFWKIDEFLAAADKHPGSGIDIALDADEMIGWQVDAKLSRKVYNFVTTNKVDKYIISTPF